MNGWRFYWSRWWGLMFGPIPVGAIIAIIAAIAFGVY
jgi:hypothetical protein